MTKALTVGFGLRVIVPLAFLAAALQSFGQGMPPIIGGGGPKVITQNEPGFQMGVQENNGTFLSSDVATGDPVVNPFPGRQTTFSRVQVSGHEYTQMGESTSADLSTRLNLRPLFGVLDDVRRFHQPPPTNSVFQAGPFFLHFYELTSGLLVSDNVNFVPNNAKWGAIAELRLRMSALVQFSPAWRLIVSGTIIYLPFNGQIGVEGFGIGDALGFTGDENLHPLTHMQLAYNSEWADWNVHMADDLSVRYLSIGAEYDNFVNGVAQPGGIHAEDQAGRYVFENGTTIPNQNLDQRQNDFLNIRTFLELENIVAGSADRLLPTETRVAFGANHSDVWFSNDQVNGGTNGLGFSDYSVDRVFAMLRNERESMRFKPFAFYDAYRYNYDPDWTHQLGAGFEGPVTDNTFFRAEAGYTWGGSLLRNSEFYRFRLVNTLTPLTRQYLIYSREVTEPVNEIRDRYLYAIHQVLGPHLWGRLYLERSVYQPDQLGIYGSVEDRAAARIIWEPVPRHSYILFGSYSENRFDNPASDRETIWLARAESRYWLRPNLVFALTYQYQNINTTQSRHVTDIAENLWVLSLRKYF